jgi:hypothetical protein
MIQIKQPWFAGFAVADNYILNLFSEITVSGENLMKQQFKCIF